MLFNRFEQIQDENLLEPYEQALYEQLMIANSEDELYAKAKALRSEVNDALARLERMMSPYLANYKCQQEREGRYFDEAEWMWCEELELDDEEEADRKLEYLAQQLEDFGRGRA